MKTQRQEQIKKEWKNPKIEKLDIRTFTKAKNQTGPESTNPGNGSCKNDGSYCP